MPAGQKPHRNTNRQRHDRMTGNNLPLSSSSHLNSIIYKMPLAETLTTEIFIQQTQNNWEQLKSLISLF